MTNWDYAECQLMWHSRLTYKPSELVPQLNRYVLGVAVCLAHQVSCIAQHKQFPLKIHQTGSKKSIWVSSIRFILEKLLTKSCLLGLHASLPLDTTAPRRPKSKTQSTWHMHTHLTSSNKLVLNNNMLYYVLECWKGIQTRLKRNKKTG